MARLEDKIAEIADGSLRQAIAEEVAKLKKRTRFGLVYEEHQPEVVPVHGARIKRGERVAKRTGSLIDLWRVLSIKEGLAHCEKDKDNAVRESFPVDQLIVVRRMGEAIYPALTPIDAVKNGDPAQPHHVLLEADNYHALQLLLFPFEAKVDCIYIDPPYNTGARDWKYNNDYVDGNDSWRHSKWLSMMQRRLRLAKRLLNPADSVLIVTIDEKEYLRLGLLLEQEFPEARIQMVSIVINGQGSSRLKAMSRVDEYAFFVYVGESRPTEAPIETLPSDDNQSQVGSERIWFPLIRGGKSGVRSKSYDSFFPIYVDDSRGCITGFGQPLPKALHPEDAESPPSGCSAVWPISKEGVEGRWQMGIDEFRSRWKAGYIRVGKRSKSGVWPITYIREGTIQRIETGEVLVEGRDQCGALILANDPSNPRGRTPKTVWYLKAHNAGTYGTDLVENFIPGRHFPFPKSLYAVEDAIRFIVSNKPDALILDFFAGSGTTAHAVMRLNHQDDGNRQCISVTNNEVSADDQAALSARGLQPGHPDWEKCGICNHITFPRLKAAITGKTPEGDTIKGDYKFTDEFPMADGFAANLEYFRLDFLDPQEVQMGRQFAAILPILWMMAGARGPRPAPPDPHTPWLLPDRCPFAVLMQETRFKDFVRHVEARQDLTHIFIVTNSADTVYKLRDEWPELRVVQLYKDYLENFRINLSESTAS